MNLNAHTLSLLGGISLWVVFAGTSLWAVLHAEEGVQGRDGYHSLAKKPERVRFRRVASDPTPPPRKDGFGPLARS